MGTLSRRLLALAVFAGLALSMPTALAQIERKYGVQTTIKFALIDPAGVDLEDSASCTTGDVQISKDEGTFANTTNCFVDEGPGDYSLVLTATEMQAARISILVDDQTASEVWLDTMVHVETYGDANAQHEFDLDSHGFALSQTAIIVGTVEDSGFTPTTSQFEASDITEATSSHFNGQYVKFVTGALAGQATTIQAYSLSGGLGHFTVATMTEAPADGDVFLIY